MCVFFFFFNLLTPLFVSHVFSKAVKLKPRFCDAYNNLASAYMQLGQTKEAIETYQVQGNIKASFKAVVFWAFPLGVPYVLRSRLQSPVLM